MKIAQVTHVYVPKIGGLENYVYRLSRDLLNQGEDVEVLTTDLDVDRGKIRPSAINVKYFHAFPVILRNPITPGLLWHLVRNRYDIIHVHSIHAFPALVAMILRKRARLIVTAHGVSPEDPHGVLKLVWSLYIPLARELCRKADRVIVLGQSEKEKAVRLLNLEPSKITVIPNGLDVANVPIPDKMVKLSEKFDIDGHRIILFAGRVLPTKNIEALIETFSQVHRNFEDTRLLIVGPVEDQYREKLRSLAQKMGIQDSVILTGVVKEEELYALYAAADIFVSLGGWEGLPTTMLEAMWLGKPCVMFSAGSVRDVICDQVSGIIVDELDNGKIADKITYLLANPDFARKMGESAKDVISANFTWNSSYKKIYKLYENVSVYDN